MALTAITLDEDTDESIAWQSAQDAVAREYLRALPSYDWFRRSLRGRIIAARSFPLRRAGDRWFQSIRLDPEADQAVVVVRDAPTGEPRVLVDPNALAARRGRPVSLAWMEPSPDGSILAFAVMAAGTEVAEVTLLDVASGEPRADVVPWNVTFAPAWLPDSTGFYCSARDFADGALRMPTYRFVLGQPAPTSPEEVPPDALFPCPIVSRDGRHVALRTGNTEPRTEYIRSESGEWTPFLRDVPGTHFGAFHGDDYIALVDDRHPRGRLVRIPVATASDPTSWRELVPEGTDVLRWVDVIDDRIVVGYLRDAACGLRVLDLDGHRVADVELPGIGSVDVWAAGFTQLLFPMFVSGAGEVSFLFCTPTSSAAVYRLAVSTGELTEVSPPETTLSGVIVRQIFTTSTDGASVAATLVHRADLDVARPQPTLIHGYGGYNVGITPGYRGAYLPFVEAGGILALAHLRGGSEYGADWWRQGRRDRKQQVFGDLYAIAEQLISSGVTTSAQLAVEGGSNGGTLVGAAVTQRPELWAAAVSQAPQLDLIGFSRDPLGYAIARIELGDPLIPEEAEWLRRISPRHNIRAGTAYPATLFTAGTNDPRCPAWHARVVAAEMRAATSSDAPILLRVHGDQGHGSSGLNAAIDQTAEWLAFVADRTGLHVR